MTFQQYLTVRKSLTPRIEDYAKAFVQNAELKHVNLNDTADWQPLWDFYLAGVEFGIIETAKQLKIEGVV